MSVTVFSSTGCIRCEIVKNFLRSRNIPFTEHDIKTAEGNKVFKAFYRERRNEIRRDENGVCFPVVHAENRLAQDAGSSLAWFMRGSALDAAVTPNNLGHGWTGGLNLSACAEEDSGIFLEILRLLKAGGLSTELSCDGNNPALLKKTLQKHLADRLKFELTAGRADEADLTQSLRTVKDHAGKAEVFYTLDIQGALGRLTPGEAAEIAKLMAESTGDNRLPLRIFSSRPEEAANLFPYRTEARRWQVLTELAR